MSNSLTELDDESRALLQLNLVPGIGPRLQSLLLNRFGSARDVFFASPADWQTVQGIGRKVADAMTAARDLQGADEEWERCHKAGIQLRFRTSPDYPELLNEIHDPPAVLYIRGSFLPQDALSVGVVGSRRCTHYGRTQAGKFSAALARHGVTIISGLARGIDAAAHQGALEHGRTLAVCAPGLAQIYPPEHRDLADRVVQQGALLSESPLLRQPVPGLFPQRNRIISGLSTGVLIVEAGRRSGALHTARHAMEQGREVFAVPGRIDSEASLGCLDLIRDGATLVRDVDDILMALGPLTTPVETESQEVVSVPRELVLNDQERMLLNLIDFAPTSIDSVLVKAEMEHSRALSTLTVLEVRRLVRRLPGGNVERISTPG